jgi:soluble P-type ATPase
MGVSVLKIDVPGFGNLNLSNVIFDYNGTIAIDGLLVPGVSILLNTLSEKLTIHVVTGDSFGTAKIQLTGINCNLVILPSDNQALAKKDYIQQLGYSATVAVGNGRNDQYMLKESILGIVVIGMEGTSVEAMMSAKVVVPDIFSALSLLQNPIKLIATLRS